MSVQPGRYRHYKGNYYEVLGSARHSETEELMVLYRPLYWEGGLWVRPEAMFEDAVLVDGRLLPRFARCECEEEQGADCQSRL